MQLLNEISDSCLFFGINNSFTNDYSFPIKSYPDGFSINLKKGEDVFLDDFVLTRANSIYGNDAYFKKMFSELFKYSNCQGKIQKISTKKTINEKNIFSVFVLYPNGKKIIINNVQMIKKIS